MLELDALPREKVDQGSFPWIWIDLWQSGGVGSFIFRDITATVFHAGHIEAGSLPFEIHLFM